MLSGVTLARVVESLNCTPLIKLMGIKIAHPNTINTKNILRHILKTLKKTVASSPMRPTKSCSDVLKTGPNQANMPFPIGGGACLSSAILSFGAYTTELYGRRRENPTARRRVNPMDVPKLAMTDRCPSCYGVRMATAEMPTLF